MNTTKQKDGGEAKVKELFHMVLRLLLCLLKKGMVKEAIAEIEKALAE